MLGGRATSSQIKEMKETESEAESNRTVVVPDSSLPPDSQESQESGRETEVDVHAESQESGRETEAHDSVQGATDGEA